MWKQGESLSAMVSSLPTSRNKNPNLNLANQRMHPPAYSAPNARPAAGDPGRYTLIGHWEYNNCMNLLHFRRFGDDRN
jgi:hypothetical protein